MLPTVTDACLLMGILDPAGFADGQMELDVAAAERAFADLDCTMPPDERVALAWRVALNNIAEEVVNVAVRHGADPRDFSLVAFGSGGPMLLAGALEMTGCRRLIVPPHPGLFSALGLLSTDTVFAEGRSAYHMLFPDAAPAIEALLSEIEIGLRKQMGADAEDVRVQRSFDGRLAGQSWETPFVEIPEGPVDVATLVTAFHAEYRRRNGQAFEDMPVQGVTWRVQLVAASRHFEWNTIPKQSGDPIPVARRMLRHLAPTPVEAAIYERADLGTGASIAGPAIIREPLATILIAPGQTGTIGTVGEIIIEATP
jgi:N-methylhydantoinase A